MDERRLRLSPGTSGHGKDWLAWGSKARPHHIELRSTDLLNQRLKHASTSLLRWPVILN
jgi:hypothetical protein